VAGGWWRAFPHYGMMCRHEHPRTASALAHQAMQALQRSGE